MKVGIFADKIIPSAGGAFTFQKSIMDNIASLKTAGFDVVVIYNGQLRGEVYKKINDIEYVNVKAYKKKCYVRFIVRKTINFFTNLKNEILLKNKVRFVLSLFDDIARCYDIDIFYFLTPIETDLTTPYIYTLWDIGYRVSPEFPEESRPIEKRETKEEGLSKMLRRATYVIIGNETGKKEILENFNLPAKKVKIVPFQITNVCYVEEEKPSFELPKQFFLYPAQFWAHKNHIRILQAMKIMRDRYGLKVTMVFTGSDKGNLAYIKRKIIEYKLDKQVIIGGFVTEGELKYLYTHASALVFASLLGPNNLPPIEAACLGCPTIISDLEGHKEQMGNGALYFDGVNAESLADVWVSYIKNNYNVSQLNKEIRKLNDKISNYLYIDQVINILNEFKIVLMTWKE